MASAGFKTHSGQTADAQKGPQADDIYIPDLDTLGRCPGRVQRVLGSGGSVPPVRASENTWAALRGSRWRPDALFPSDLPRDGKFSFPAETSRKSSALLMCYQLSRKREKSVTRNSEATFREIMESVRMCRDNFSIGVVEHPHT